LGRADAQHSAATALSCSTSPADGYERRYAPCWHAANGTRTM